MTNLPQCEEKDLLHDLCSEINPLLTKLRYNIVAIRMKVDYFQTSDSFPLFYRKWPCNENQADFPKKIIVCIHGLHSHGEKFVIFADEFIKQQWDTYAIDLRGHGLSWLDPKNKGDIPDYNVWMRDIHEFLNFLIEKYPKIPIYFLAESMGAAATIHIAKANQNNIRALILLSPAVKPWETIQFTMILEAFTYAVTKSIDGTVIPQRGSGRFATDSEDYMRYQLHDPLRITNVSPRYYYQIIKMIHRLKENSYENFIPTCIFFGEKDFLVQFDGVKKFIHEMQKTPKALHFIPQAHHDLLTDDEAHKYEMNKKIIDWINEY